MVINFVGMKLLVDPIVDAHCIDSLDVTGTWSEGEPVEGVHGPLLLVHLDDGRIFIILFGVFFFRAGKLNADGKAQDG